MAFGFDTLAALIEPKPDVPVAPSVSPAAAQQAAISGEVNWQQLTYPVSAGSHLLRWTYAKDSSVNTGSDAAWLDQVNLVTNPPVITLQPLSQTASMGALLSMSVSALGAPPFVYQWLKGGTNLVGATTQTYTILNATRRDSSVYSVLVSNPGGTTASSNAIITIRVPQSLGIPSRGPDDKFRLTSGDADRGALLPGDLANIEPQVSTNLVDWAPLTNSVMLTNGVLLVIDPQSTNYPTRFYRVIER